MNSTDQPLLDIRNLRVSFAIDGGVVRAVDNIDLTVHPGQVLGIVGESGSGKSVTGLSILRLLAKNARIESGEILLRQGIKQIDLARINPLSREMGRVRGGEIALIFQEPMAAFSPVHTVGNQMIETIRLHGKLSKREARDNAIDLLRRVGISNPEHRIDQYAFELSGGMRQRALIAIALAGNPSLLIADEPTTALDVTIQAQILELLKTIQTDTGMAIIFITHDLGVIAQLADEIAVMYLGKIVERGTVDSIFHNPKHPYTMNLLQAVIGAKHRRERLSTIPGQIPSPYDRPQGCPFHTRCMQMILGRCDLLEPVRTSVEDKHTVSCFLYE